MKCRNVFIIFQAAKKNKEITLIEGGGGVKAIIWFKCVSVCVHLFQFYLK